ncbi:carboxyl-terminal peptidase [Medicago truncatula]|uniref:Carboxyl-terminal peptidase n=1 Tax=Medicago truncatula TaxID=3880 RepID=A0A072U304_MEDTR|nr:carboxyl-terminal peptidase [Medicago truncatula]
MTNGFFLLLHTEQHAMASVQGDGYTGASAVLNIWQPKLDYCYEFSAAKILLSSQKSGDIIETGWQVYQHLYGDGRPRLFIHWTADPERQNGCYDLKCSGFVQTHNKVVLGGSVTPASIYDGKQYGLKLTIWKDPNNGNWWLELESGIHIGYWPASLFTELKGEAYFAEFGGEVFNLKPSGAHTSTEMGSGHFVSGRGFGRAAFIKKMKVAVTEQNVYIDLPDPDFSSDHPNCYNVKGGFIKDWGSYLYYGGPGYNKNCP